MPEKNFALIIVGIVAIVAIVGLLNFNGMTGKSIIISGEERFVSEVDCTGKDDKYTCSSYVTKEGGTFSGRVPCNDGTGDLCYKYYYRTNN